MMKLAVGDLPRRVFHEVRRRRVEHAAPAPRKGELGAADRVDRYARRIG